MAPGCVVCAEILHVRGDCVRASVAQSNVGLSSRLGTVSRVTRPGHRWKMVERVVGAHDQRGRLVFDVERGVEHNRRRHSRHRAKIIDPQSHEIAKRGVGGSRAATRQVAGPADREALRRGINCVEKVSRLLAPRRIDSERPGRSVLGNASPRESRHFLRRGSRRRIAERGRRNGAGLGRRRFICADWRHLRCAGKGEQNGE